MGLGPRQGRQRDTTGWTYAPSGLGTLLQGPCPGGHSNCSEHPQLDVPTLQRPFHFTRLKETLSLWSALSPALKPSVVSRETIKAFHVCMTKPGVKEAARKYFPWCKERDWFTRANIYLECTVHVLFKKKKETFKNMSAICQLGINHWEKHQYLPC